MTHDTLERARPRALVVEDDPSAGEIATAMLDLLGYDARVAIDAQTAFRAMSSDPPDLLMLDVCLPDLDGPKVLRVARRLQGSADVPTIAASAIVTRGAPQVEELRGLGVSEFLTKPFNLPQLRLALSRAHPRGPCGAVGPAKVLDLPAELIWDQGRTEAPVRGVRPLSAQLEAAARGLHPGQEVQLKLHRDHVEGGEMLRTPVRIFGDLHEVRATEHGSRVEVRVQTAVPREHWLALCDDARR